MKRAVSAAFVVVAAFAVPALAQQSEALASLPYRQPYVYTPPVYTPPVYAPYVLPASPLLTSQSGTSYDPRSGNTYTWRRQSNGDTRVDGFNVKTGVMWNTTIKPDGSMNGTDARRQPWTYDARTRTYQNFGTGKFCVGEGYARVCSGR